MTFKSTATIFFLLLACGGQAQEILKLRPSPLAIAAVRYQDNYIKITYSQPQKKNRKIFGELVPFGEVWRTGANEATELTTVKDIQLQDILLKAGTYSLFTIPEKDKWTIIINSDVGLWGSYNYNEAKDVYRFDVPVQSADKIFEPFTISFENRNDVAELLMMWDDVKVSVPIKFIK
ncbi:MAG TPA: DUF2911 domain-containing protein [Chryseosolibacter sp.]|nr:DUF2911 domain-containing protein [Chryseosolibacter sp.]